MKCLAEFAPAGARPYKPEYFASAQTRMLDDSGVTFLPKRKPSFRFGEEEP